MRLLPLVASALFFSAVYAEGPPVPRRSPEFALTYVDGSQKLLSNYRGKVVLLAFVHTTCPHCQQDSQKFSKLYTEYGARGFQPLGVAWNENAKTLVPEFARMYNLNFPLAYASREAVLDYLGMSPMVRSVVPQLVWVDKKGMIRAQTPPPGDDKMYSESYWREMIETLTAEPESSAKKRGPVHTASK